MNTTQTPAASKELAASEQKYFSAESIEIKVPSFSSGVKPQSYKDKLLTQGTVVMLGRNHPDPPGVLAWVYHALVFPLFV